MQRKQDPQAELWEPFLAGYTAALKGRRAVLRFDTAERLEYERDSPEVREDCEVEEQDAPSWEWLLERIGRLPQTTILIAARPTPTGLLRERLQEAHRSRVQVLKIASFTPEETVAYLREAEFGIELIQDSPDLAGRIHQLTQGRPILIALTLDWLQRGNWDRHKLFTIPPDDFEMALVAAIRDLRSPLDKAVKYAALARKGYNADLLSRLMGISIEEAQRLMEQMAALSFVKQPRGERNLYFLHDEMYDLVERYVWLIDWPDYSRQAELDQVIIRWYDEQIEDLYEKIKQARDYRERGRLRRQQQVLMAERLYYQFDADPREGQRQYTRMDEEAIAARELAWDVLLRNEALWFTGHRGWRVVYKGPTRRKDGRIVRSPGVDHDCRRRWVSRYIASQQWDLAIRIAGKLLQKAPLEEEPKLYRPGLRIALATAQAYRGGDLIEPALENFQKGIRQIERAFDDAPDDHRNPWLQNHLLGLAHLYQGLALRSTPRLSDAAESYQQATYYFRQNDYRVGLAEALNNLAFIYARRGKAERASGLVDQALKIRQELGDEYPIGLSLNTKGIIYERRGLP